WLLDRPRRLFANKRQAGPRVELRGNVPSEQRKWTARHFQGRTSFGRHKTLARPANCSRVRTPKPTPTLPSGPRVRRECRAEASPRSPGNKRCKVRSAKNKNGDRRRYWNFVGLEGMPSDMAVTRSTASSARRRQR